jgi:tetratricopeptide (TPR) repeat protein
MLTLTEFHEAKYNHAAFYVKQLQLANVLYRKGGAQIGHSLTKLSQDWAQIEQGQSWAVSAIDEERATRLCSEFASAGVDLLSLRQSTADRIRWLETAVEATQRLGQDRVEAEHLCQLGRVYWQAGRVERAVECLQEALAIAQAVRYQPSIAQAHYYWSEITTSQADYEASKEHCAICLPLFERLKDSRGVADSLASLGNVALFQDEYDLATDYFQRSLLLYRTLGEQVGEARVLARFASLAGSLRDFTLAEQYSTQSYQIYCRLNHLEGMGLTLNLLGTCATCRGDYGQAAAWFQDSLKTFERLGSPDGIAGAHYKLGEVEHYTGNYAQSREHYRTALEIYQSIKNAARIAGIIFRLGNVARTIQDYEEATQWFQQCLDLCREQDNKSLFAASLNALASMAYEQQRYEEAQPLFETALAAALEVDDTWVIADIHQEWGGMLMEMDQLSPAKEHLYQALTLAVDMEAVPLALSIVGSVAKLMHLSSQPDQALALATYIYEHPASLETDKDTAQALLQTLPSTLSPQAAARFRGQDLKMVVQTLLSSPL